MKKIVGELASGTTGPAPEIECWIPEANKSGVGVIIFPGGGYGGLAEHEGKGYAERMCDAGLSCFVVKYRLGTDGFRHPAMLEDALAAVGTVRARAPEFGVDPAKLGVMGSSAGGHLTAHALVAWDTYESDVSLRPDFGVLCYPVILSAGDFVNRGSIRNLCGPDPSPELLTEVSVALHVKEDTPPCFLWHTGEDTGVPMENSLAFASALRDKGVPLELHLYQRGRHGLGLGADFDWMTDLLRWISQL